MVYPYNGILFSNTKEHDINVCYSMEEPQEHAKWASLVAQWLGICLPMQGTQVRALVWEDPTYRGATKPVCHNY